MSTTQGSRPGQFVDEDAKHDYLKKRARKKYKAKARFYRREAENDNGELNLTAMMDMMTILLVFLIKSYGASEVSVAMGEDLKPPNSKSTLFPTPAVTVTITKKDIAVGERGVLKLEQGGKKIPDDALSGLLILPVQEKLRTEIEKLEKIAQFNPAMRAKAGTDKDPTKMLIVVGDKDMPYSILFSVLGTAGQSGLKYFKFLTVNPVG
jgi:biopolymer transport protein ExbD